MRNRIINAIERLEYRVTVGDVAAKAGLEINRTYTELLVLASDVGGHLKVSQSGEIVFQFPKQIRNILYQKFWKIRFSQFWQTIGKGLFYILRISFGILLILSIAIQLIAIIFIAIAAIFNSEETTRRSRKASLNNNDCLVSTFLSFPSSAPLRDGSRYNGGNPRNALPPLREIKQHFLRLQLTKKNYFDSHFQSHFT